MKLSQEMHIAVFAFDGMTTFHLATPLLAFGEVSRQALAAGWHTSVWTADGSPVRTEEGVHVDSVGDAESVASADMIVFPSWHSAVVEPSDDLIEVIRRAHARGAVIVGLCLGAFPVVSSGILDGRAAATHWAGAHELARQYPAVDVHDEALYIDHGDVLTSAGTASALDACLHIVRERLGATAATSVARQLVVAPHREGDQAQYIAQPILDVGEGPLGETMEWALANLDRVVSVDDLASFARMSPRNFSRRFREQVGMTPAKWMLARRLDEARRLLETTTWSITRVAQTCGFASPVTFRQNFVTRFATTPTSYRHRFAASAQ